MARFDEPNAESVARGSGRAAQIRTADDGGVRLMIVLQRGAIESRLRQACGEAGVVGASIAVASSDGAVTACFGTTSVRDSFPIVPQTKFRTGSVCKVYTAALLVETLLAHGLSPDVRVVDLLPDFRLMDNGEQDIRVRHLLSHSSGINSDFWEDRFGDDDHAIARYVTALSSVRAMFPAGATWAYSNSGFVVTGRLVEALTGTPFRTQFEAFLQRLHLTETEILHGPTPRNYANGHYREATGLREANTVEESRALLPAGSGLFASARDVALFARLLVLPDSPLGHAALLMREPVLEMPPAGLDEPTHHGLGWKIYDWPQGLLVGHNGNGTGQFAWVRADVATGMSIAVMVNTIPSGAAVWHAIAPRFWAEVGAEPNKPIVPKQDGDPPSAQPLCGTYRMTGATFDVTDNGDGIKISMKAFDDEPVETEARYADDYRYATAGGWAIVFEPVGEDLCLHYGPLTARRDTTAGQ